MELLLAFGIIAIIISIMSIGVLFKREPIQGSCGGLNAIAGTDECVVCQLPVDTNSPLRDKLECPRAKEMVEKFKE